MVLTLLKRFLLSQVLTLYYNVKTAALLAVYVVLHPFSNPWARKLRLKPPDELVDPKYGTHKYIKVNDMKIHYVESGDSSKPLMIFIHGFPEFWYSWRYQILEFQKDYWCIAIDMRGYGDSEKPEEQSAYNMNYVTEDVRDLMRKLGREKCILVAHDWGTMIAWRFRDLYPEALSALVTLAGSSSHAWNQSLWSDSEQFWKSWYVFLLRGWWLPEQTLIFNDMEIFDKGMRLQGNDNISAADIECYKYTFGKPAAFTPPINYYRENFTYVNPEKPRCEAIIPSLFVHGKDDLYLVEMNGVNVQKLYANVEFVILEGCRHFLQQEEPKRINGLIREFLAKNKLS